MGYAIKNQQIRSNFTFSVGWGGWLEKVRIKLNSTQVVVEVRVELGNDLIWLLSGLLEREMI